MSNELTLRPQQQPACLEPGYRFTSQRARLQLREPLTCLLQMLNISPLEIPKVEEFMCQRLDELEHPKSLKTELKWRMAYSVLLCVLVSLGIASFAVAPFEVAWVISMGLLIPVLIIIVRITNPLMAAPAPAEWCEQGFWAYRKAVKFSDHAVPSHILEIAEKIQTLFPATVLTVIYLYSDAFLCARHETPLGDQECLVAVHWGQHLFMG